MEKFLYAGTGKTEIQYCDAMFPTYGENYTKIHDLPMMQALLLKSEETIALISVDVVMLEIKEQMLKAAGEILEIPEEKILIHATHVLATPHFKEWESVTEWKTEHKTDQVTFTDEEAEEYWKRELLIVKAHMDALKEVCRQAKSNIQQVKIGFGEAYAAINVNRVVETKNGWWQGVNQDGDTDHCVPVIRFDDLNDKPIAIWYNCNVAPGCMEFSTVDGGRWVSGDLAGASQRFIDRMFHEDVVSIYTTGFTGDQWQALRARVDYIDREGNQIIEDLHEEGFLMPRILGIRLGEQVAKTAAGIKTRATEKGIHLETYRFVYDGQQVSCRENAGPVRTCAYTVKGKQEAEIKILLLNDICIVFCGVELCSQTFFKIKEKAPFKHMFIMEFTTEGGGYMPEEVFYDRMSFQSRKSRYAKGSAEKFAIEVIGALEDMYKKYCRNDV